MKYLLKLLLCFKEIFIVLLLQYVILFITVYILGVDKSILWGSIFLVFLEVLYMIWKFYGIKKDNVKFNILGNKFDYFPYILLGIGVNAVYNMIIFKLGLEFEVTVHFPLIITLICSGIIGPIYEEILFRYDLIRRMEMITSNKWVIIIVSSFVFGIVHINPVSIIYGTIVGFIYSYFYVNDKDFLKPIIVHIAGNIFVQFLYGYNVWILIFGIILIVASALIIKNYD